MGIYAMKISDISEEKLNELCLLIDLEKKYKVQKFVNKKDKIRTVIGIKEIKYIDYKEIAKNFFETKEFEYIVN